MMKQGIVGRAELKLAEAVKAFGYDFRGKTVLDIGSSTGGFTEFALKQGADRVIAVEKGTNQMARPLRFDPRIMLLEKTDIFTLRFKPLTREKHLTSKDWDEQEVVYMPQLFGVVDVILADVSFVSLTKVLMYAKMELARRDTDFLVMLKPQFEARSEYLVKGVVKNERMRREVLRDFEWWLGKNGFVILKKRDNETVGKVGGNRERFYWLRLAKK